jgi:hypothetical protein
MASHVVSDSCAPPPEHFRGRSSGHVEGPFHFARKHLPSQERPFRTVAVQAPGMHRPSIDQPCLQFANTFLCSAHTIMQSPMCRLEISTWLPCTLRCIVLLPGMPAREASWPARCKMRDSQSVIFQRQRPESQKRKKRNNGLKSNNTKT